MIPSDLQGRILQIPGDVINDRYPSFSAKTPQARIRFTTMRGPHLA